MNITDLMAASGRTPARVNLPRGISADIIGNGPSEEITLTDRQGGVLLVGPNGRGGFGFRTPHEIEWHGNYASLADAVRCAAQDGFTNEPKI